MTSKINSKQMNSLNLRAKNIKHVEENIEVNLHNFGFVSVFLNMIP